MKNKKGFTLIELLAVIVILAVIALIAVPQILKILSQARISAAEDSTYGIYNATQDYISRVMLSNGGDFPSEDLTFTCDNTSCKLDNYATLVSEGYNLEETLDYKGKKATDGKIKVTNGGKDITIENIKVSGFYCSHDGDRATCSKDESEIQPVALYGYSTVGIEYYPFDSSLISTTRPTDKNLYLRYKLKNGVYDDEILPDVCLYVESNPMKELCLNCIDFQTSRQNFIDFFGCDINSQNNDCFYTDDSYDYDDTSYLIQGRRLGYVYVSSSIVRSSCEVWPEDGFDCHSWD